MTKTHSITLPDGTTATRQSKTRAYTHAVIVVTTAAERDRRIAASSRVIAACEDQIRHLRVLADEDDKISYEKAVARMNYLQEDVPQTAQDHSGATYQTTKPRFLSDEFDGIHGSGSNALHEAQSLRDATVTGKIARLEEKIQDERSVYLAPAQARPVGQAYVYRWSLTRKGAELGLDEVHRNRPLDDMFITDKIVVK